MRIIDKKPSKSKHNSVLMPTLFSFLCGPILDWLACHICPLGTNQAKVEICKAYGKVSWSQMIQDRHLADTSLLGWKCRSSSHPSAANLFPSILVSKYSGILASKYPSMAPGINLCSWLFESRQIFHIVGIVLYFPALLDVLL